MTIKFINKMNSEKFEFSKIFELSHIRNKKIMD